MTEQAFAAALLDPSAALPPGLIDPMGRPAPIRFNVYRNNVAASLVRALEDGFPLVRRLVGPPFFAAMALVHLRESPPKGPLLMHYGVDFPDFLDRFPPVAHLGYLPDMARVDLLLRESYHAADATALDGVAVASMDPVRLLSCKVHLAPSLRLLRSAWPVHAIWRANAENGPPPVMQAEDIVITRPVFDPRPHLLGPGGAVVLQALRDGQTLETALDLAPDCDLPALLTLLLRERAIERIES